MDTQYRDITCKFRGKIFFLAQTEHTNPSQKWDSKVPNANYQNTEIICFHNTIILEALEELFKSQVTL
jgi:hypothetical protein